MSSEDFSATSAEHGGGTADPAPVPPPWAWAPGAVSPAGPPVPPGPVTPYALTAEPGPYRRSPVEPEYRQWSPKQTAVAVAAAVAIACVGTIGVAWADKGSSSAAQTGGGFGNRQGGFGGPGGFGGQLGGGTGTQGGTGPGGAVPAPTNT